MIVHTLAYALSCTRPRELFSVSPTPYCDVTAVGVSHKIGQLNPAAVFDIYDMLMIACKYSIPIGHVSKKLVGRVTF